MSRLGMLIKVTARAVYLVLPILWTPVYVVPFVVLIAGAGCELILILSESYSLHCIWLLNCGN